MLTCLFMFSWCLLYLKRYLAINVMVIIIIYDKIYNNTILCVHIFSAQHSDDLADRRGEECALRHLRRRHDIL